MKQVISTELNHLGKHVTYGNLIDIDTQETEYFAMLSTHDTLKCYYFDNELDALYKAIDLKMEQDKQ